jgi:hypothetical protein
MNLLKMEMKSRRRVAAADRSLWIRAASAPEAHIVIDGLLLFEASRRADQERGIIPRATAQHPSLARVGSQGIGSRRIAIVCI